MRLIRFDPGRRRCRVKQDRILFLGVLRGNAFPITEKELSQYKYLPEANKFVTDTGRFSASGRKTGADEEKKVMENGDAYAGNQNRVSGAETTVTLLPRKQDDTVTNRIALSSPA